MMEDAQTKLAIEMAIDRHGMHAVFSSEKADGDVVTPVLQEDVAEHSCFEWSSDSSDDDEEGKFILDQCVHEEVSHVDDE